MQAYLLQLPTFAGMGLTHRTKHLPSVVRSLVAGTTTSACMEWKKGTPTSHPPSFQYVLRGLAPN